jgi:deoxyribonuclease-4
VRIGAHVPVRGGILGAVRAAAECRAEAVQIFASNPRGWAPPRIARAEAELFREAFPRAGLGPLFVHAPYLVNVASPNPEFLRKSIELARLTLAACDEIGAAGLVVHAGSGGPGEPGEALERATASLRTLAAESGPAVIVELTAGTSGSVAATIADALRLFEAVDHPRLALCLDTCHLFAAGYALDRPEGVAACFDELRASGLGPRLLLVHANDAKHPRGSRLDRHEHIGEGHIGVEGFFEILRRPELADLALVVETPGPLHELARNIATLRRLATSSVTD